MTDPDHMRLRRLTTALLIPSAALVYAAEPATGYYYHNDWEIACDNTRTCRAAGYQADEDENGISILLTRAAGPASPVQVQMQLADTATVTPAALTFRIGRRALGDVHLDKNARGTLTASQTEALLPALLTDSPLTWSAKNTTWTVSTKGANAVLLKMDDIQGRIGTPGALVRKGTRPESSVLPRLPAPVVNASPVDSNKPNINLVPAPQRQALLAELRKTLGDRDDNKCEAFEENTKDPHRLTIYRLSASKLLVSVGCYVAAYNSGDAYWVTNVHTPFSPVLVTSSANDYTDGRILYSVRGRGIGDCMRSDTWTWDGGQFIHTASLSTGMCKEIAAGGAWELPTLVTEVNRKK